MKTITSITSVAVDSPTAGKITIVASYSEQTIGQPAQQKTVPEFPTNPNWSRAHRISNLAYTVLRNGANPVSWLLNALAGIACALEPSLSWPPIISTQPGAASCNFAKGTLTSNNTIPSDADQVTIGSKTYTFKTTLTPTEGQVLINGSADAALLNLIRAINHTGTPDTDYKCAAANTQVSAATAVTNHAFQVTSLAIGTAANSIATTTPTGATLSWGATTLLGGTAATTFAVVAGVTESTITYLWQYSSDGGTTWSTATGTVSGTTYTNGTTATLTCTPTTTGQTGKLHRCAVTNASGTTNTSSAALTIS